MTGRSWEGWGERPVPAEGATWMGRSCPCPGCCRGMGVKPTPHPRVPRRAGFLPPDSACVPPPQEVSPKCPQCQGPWCGWRCQQDLGWHLGHIWGPLYERLHIWGRVTHLGTRATCGRAAPRWPRGDCTRPLPEMGKLRHDPSPDTPSPLPGVGSQLPPPCPLGSARTCAPTVPKHPRRGVIACAG